MGGAETLWASDSDGCAVGAAGVSCGEGTGGCAVGAVEAVSWAGSCGGGTGAAALRAWEADLDAEARFRYASYRLQRLTAEANMPQNTTMAGSAPPIPA